MANDEAEDEIEVDFISGVVVVRHGGQQAEHSLGSAEGFRAVSRAWLRAGWDARYVYSFTWMGRPIIQLPEDLLRLQEVIAWVQPKVIVESGVAHGGSLVFAASLLKNLGGGRVIGIDIDIRPHNREAIEAHALSDMITLIDGDSTDPAVISAVHADVGDEGPVMVLLDSKHDREHVSKELEAYAPLVSPGSYIVAMDGIMGDLANAPRTEPGWADDNPRVAAEEFVAAHPEFEQDQPSFAFNEGAVDTPVTYWPGGYLRRRA